MRTRLTQLVGQGLTDWENIRQQIKEYNSTTSRGLLEEITNLVENNSNICKTTEENKDILDLEKLNSPNFNSNKLFRGDYVITAKKCENNIDARGDRDFPKYCVEDKNNNSIDFKYSWYTMDSIRRQLSNNDEELAANISDFAIDPSENCNTEEEEDEAEEMNCDNLIIDAYEAAQSTSKKDSDLIEGEEEETVFELADYTYEEKKFIEGLFPPEQQPGYIGAVTDAATAMGKTVANTGTRAVEVAYDTAAAVGDAAAAVGDAVGETGARAVGVAYDTAAAVGDAAAAVGDAVGLRGVGGQIESNKKEKELKKLKNLYKKMNNKKNKKQAEIEKLKKYIKTK